MPTQLVPMESQVNGRVLYQHTCGKPDCGKKYTSQSKTSAGCCHSHKMWVYRHRKLEDDRVKRQEVVAELGPAAPFNWRVAQAAEDALHLANEKRELLDKIARIEKMIAEKPTDGLKNSLFLTRRRLEERFGVNA